MGRPAKGAVRWNPRTSVWEVRVTLRDGTRSRPIAMTGLAPCVVNGASPPDDCACTACTFANDSGQRVSKRMRDGGAVEVATEETATEWFGRYFDWREARDKRAESIDDSRGRIRKWVERNEKSPLGTTPMKRVSRALLEDFVAFLDEQVEEEIIATKTAGNIWGELSAGFAVATNCKDKRLRVLTVNPAADVEGPDDGETKQKPFLRPDEVMKLLDCAVVPIERRHVYAMAIYTAMRQGKLRALRVRDADFEAMQITVVRQVKNGKEKDRTKRGARASSPCAAAPRARRRPAAR